MGNNGSTTNSGAAGAGAGAGAGVGVGALGAAFFLFTFFGPGLPFSKRAGIIAQQQQRSANKDHCQSSKKEPEEPDAVEPELPSEPLGSLPLLAGS